MDERRVLAVFAPPEDEAFRPRGTPTLLAQRGVRFYLLTATRGEAGFRNVKNRAQAFAALAASGGLLLRANAILVVLVALFLGAPLFGLLAVFWLVVTFRTLVGVHTGQAWVR